MTTKWTTRMGIVGAALAAAVLCTPAVASAERQQYTMVPLMYTLGQNNSIPCAGQMTSSVLAPDHRPGMAIVSVTWATFFVNPCSITAHVDYWNADTGVRGTRSVDLVSSGGGFGPPPGRDWSKTVEIDLGSGNAGITVRTDSLNTTQLVPNQTTVRFTVA